MLSRQHLSPCPNEDVSTPRTKSRPVPDSTDNATAGILKDGLFINDESLVVDDIHYIEIIKSKAKQKQ